MVGGFDESFAAGEDIDFTWRLNDAGYRLRWVPNAVVEHDWGDTRRQMRRSFSYGAAWARLFRKHPRRLKAALRDYPVAVVYPLFLLGLPLTIRYRAYPLLLLIPLWRARHEEAPLRVLLDHLVSGRGRHRRGGRALPVSAPVRVLVTPKDENPYQRLLYDEVIAAGAEVRYLEGPSRSSDVQSAGRPAGAGAVPASSATGCCTSTGCSSSRCRGPAARRLPRRVMQWWFWFYLWSAEDPRLPHRVDRPRPVAARPGLLRRSRGTSAPHRSSGRGDRSVARKREGARRAWRDRRTGDPIRLLRRTVCDKPRAPGGEEGAGPCGR